MTQNFEDLKGKIIKNPNGFFYIVFDKALDASNSSKEMILLKLYYDESFIFAVPSDIFFSKVNKSKFPDVQQEYNFQLTNEPIPKLSKNLPKIDLSITRDSIDFKGKTVRDWNSNIYEVLSLAIESTSAIPLVLYRDFNDKSKLYTIPKTNFLSKIDKKIYPSAIQEYNFEIISSDRNVLSSDLIILEEDKKLKSFNPFPHKLIIIILILIIILFIAANVILTRYFQF